MKFSYAYHTAMKLQRLIDKAADTATPKELSMMGATFAKIEMLKLRLRMKPAPKPIDTTKMAKPTRNTHANGPAET